MFGAMVWYLINPLLNTIGMAMLMSEKGALQGFFLGLIVTVIFNGTAYFASLVGNPQGFPPAEYLLVTLIGSLLFYALPATILGHLRKS
jgi:hypothetical protein